MDGKGVLGCSRRGFTLIELLVVIAIILILVAIALPNFLEAQIRARAAKAKGEIRTLAIAMESYYLDWKHYPSFSFPNYTQTDAGRMTAGLTWLTSPIAYIKSLPEDPFPGDQRPGFHNILGEPYSYVLDGVQTPVFELMHPDAGGAGLLKAWCIYSLGPDRPDAEISAIHNANPIFNEGNPIYTYSPTNGTKSKGDIMRWGGDPKWMGVAVSRSLTAFDDLYKSYAKPGQVVNDILYIGRFPQGLH